MHQGMAWPPARVCRASGLACVRRPSPARPPARTEARLCGADHGRSDVPSDVAWPPRQDVLLSGRGDQADLSGHFERLASPG